MENRTNIVIAHRLTTVQKCKKLVVLQEGKIVEEGAYSELQGNQNSYFKKLQSGMEKNK